MIYLFIFLYLIFLSYYYDYRNNRGNRESHYFVVLFLLICVAGFRYRIGIDSIRYQMSYYYLPTLNALTASDFLEQKYDPLYLLLSSACKSISQYFWTIQMAQAILVNTIFFRFFKKNTKNYFFAILLYYLLLYISNMTETMRESCAIAMMLLAWEKYKENKIVMVAFYFFLAFLFHSSAIILLLVLIPLIFSQETNVRFSVKTISIALSTLVLGSIVQEFFLDNIDLIALNSRLEDKIDMYSEKGMFASKINIFGILTSMILYGFIPYVCAKTLREEKDSYRLEYFLVVEMFCAALATPIYMFYRYVNYFLPFVILAICRTLSKRRFVMPGVATFRTSALLAWIVLSSPFVIIQARIMLAPEWPSGPRTYSRYYPYSSIFTYERNDDREEIFLKYIYGY